MTRGPNLKKLATLAGVTPGTVSRALSGSGRVNEQTRLRIVDLAQSLGYQPNLLARTMRTRKTMTVGMLVPIGHDTLQHLSDPFFNTLSGLLADELADHSYDLLLSRVIPKDDRWIESYANSGRVDGILIIGQSNQLPVIEATSLRYNPLVVWGGQVRGQNHCAIGSDNRAGAMIAVRHLLDRGCRNIAYMGPVDGPEFGDRIEGARYGIALAGLADQLPVFATHNEPTAAFDDALRVFGGLTRFPDGIFVSSDETAISVIRALAQFGYGVPDDVKVVGYDGLPLGELVSPALTTIDQQLRLGAKLMVETLLRRMAGEVVGSIMIEPRLIVRKST